MFQNLCFWFGIFNNKGSFYTIGFKNIHTKYDKHASLKFIYKIGAWRLDAWKLKHCLSLNYHFGDANFSKKVRQNCRNSFTRKKMFVGKKIDFRCQFSWRWSAMYLQVLRKSFTGKKMSLLKCNQIMKVKKLSFFNNFFGLPQK